MLAKNTSSKTKILVGISAFFIFIFGYSVYNGSENQKEDNSSNLKVKQIDKKAIAEYELQRINLQAALDLYFRKAIASGDMVGAGVSIVQGDSILISTGFGKRNVNSKIKIDDETIFRLGSLSKGFGGILAASLESEGKFGFDDKVTDYLPEFKLGDKSNTDKVKIAHILSHSSGAPYHSFTNLVEANLDMSKILNQLHEIEPQNSPNQQYSYQNAIFALSQEIFSKVTEDDVTLLLKNRFFEPLDMTNTSMSHADLMKEKNVALPHTRGKNGWKSIALKNRYYNAVVAGGINASSLDMAKWMRFLLGRNPEVLPSSVIEKVFNPVIKIDFNNKYYQRWPGYKESHYGFGWRIHQFQESETSPKELVWHHGGSVNNYRNEIAIFPNDDLGICVLLNGNSRIAQTVIPDLYELVKNTFDLRSL